MSRTRLLPALVLGLVSVVVPAGPARAAEPVDLFISAAADSPDPVFANSTVSYDVSVGNRGPGTATGTVVTASLPAGVSFRPVDWDDRCSATSTLITCDLGTLPASGMASPLIIQVTPTQAGTLSMTFTVSAAEHDAHPSDNVRTATTTVTTPTDADVALTLKGPYEPVHAGAQFAVTAEMSNSGPAPATGVTARLRVPAGLSLDASCVPDGPDSICTLGPTQLPAPAGSAALIRATASAPGSYTISGAISADQPDPQPANNNGSTSFTVLPAADLAVSISESADPSLPGRPLTYTVTVANHGPSPSTAHLTDEWSTTVAGGLALVAVVASQGGCETPTAWRVECDLGVLAAGATATVAVSLRPQGVGTVTNQARVTGSEYDRVPTNDTATETTAVK